MFSLRELGSRRKIFGGNGKGEGKSVGIGKGRKKLVNENGEWGEACKATVLKIVKDSNKKKRK